MEVIENHDTNSIIITEDDKDLLEITIIEEKLVWIFNTRKKIIINKEIDYKLYSSIDYLMNNKDDFCFINKDFSLEEDLKDRLYIKKIEDQYIIWANNDICSKYNINYFNYIINFSKEDIINNNLDVLYNNILSNKKVRYK